MNPIKFVTKHTNNKNSPQQEAEKTSASNDVTFILDLRAECFPIWPRCSFVELQCAMTNICNQEKNCALAHIHTQLQIKQI